MLVVTVVDSKNTTHVIQFKSDHTNYDKEIPIMNHIINSYKLLNNVHVLNQTNTNYGALMGNNNLTNTIINKKEQYVFHFFKFNNNR